MHTFTRECAVLDIAGRARPRAKVKGSIRLGPLLSRRGEAKAN